MGSFRPASRKSHRRARHAQGRASQSRVKGLGSIRQNRGNRIDPPARGFVGYKGPRQGTTRRTSLPNRPSAPAQPADQHHQRSATAHQPAARARQQVSCKPEPQRTASRHHAGDNRLLSGPRRVAPNRKRRRLYARIVADCKLSTLRLLRPLSSSRFLQPPYRSRRNMHTNEPGCRRPPNA
jgi:hypothetical protein